MQWHELASGLDVLDSIDAVIPAKAGIQYLLQNVYFLDPGSCAHLGIRRDDDTQIVSVISLIHFCVLLIIALNCIIQRFRPWWFHPLPPAWRAPFPGRQEWRPFFRPVRRGVFLRRIHDCATRSFSCAGARCARSQGAVRQEHRGSSCHSARKNLVFLV